MSVGIDARHRGRSPSSRSAAGGAPSAVTAYPDADRLLITADGGGSNGSRATAVEDRAR